MKTTYSRACEIVFAYEGGRVDNPHDPGGRTNMGVTQRNYNAWREENGFPLRDVFLMEKKEADAIYYADYAAPIKYDALPAGIDLATFDFAINSGVARSVKVLQSIVGASADGIVGSRTLAAIKTAMRADERGTILRYTDARMKFLRGLSIFSRFGKGWTRRVEGDHAGAQDDDIGIVDRAVKMAEGDQMYGGLPTQPASGKGWPEDLDPASVSGDLIRAADAISAIAMNLVR